MSCHCKTQLVKLTVHVFDHFLRCSIWLCFSLSTETPPSSSSVLRYDGVPVAQWEGPGAAEPSAPAGPAVWLHLCGGRGGLQGPQSCAGSLQCLLPHALPGPERCGASGHQQCSRWVPISVRTTYLCITFFLNICSALLSQCFHCCTTTLVALCGENNLQS